MDEFRVKRAYRAARRSDGARVLVDRLWPRGMSKDRLRLTDWIKDLAPSEDLRRWFGHDPDRWETFCDRYAGELDAKPDAVASLRTRAAEGPVTLIYAAKDEAHNNAVALKHYLEEHPGDARPPDAALRPSRLRLPDHPGRNGRRGAVGARRRGLRGVRLRLLGMVREQPALIAREIAAVRARTARPFAVNLIPSATDPALFAEELAACLEARVHGMVFFWDIDAHAIAADAAAGTSVRRPRPPRA